MRESGIKVVLTGEGADEMFAGYDLFREAKVRRFWARQPASTLRPRLLERLYPYLARSPVAQRAMARQFFGRDLDALGGARLRPPDRAGSDRALKRLFSPDAARARRRGVDVPSALLAIAARPSSARWSLLAQDQYLEVRTLLSGYLLSSQGDRMLMAHSVEGRFPFLDRERRRRWRTRCRRRTSCACSTRSTSSSAPPQGLVPDEIIRAAEAAVPRARRARRSSAPARPDWVAEVVSERAVAEAGVFDPAAVGRLWRKCRDAADGGQFSNADNMALVGVLSTGLLHERLVRQTPSRTMPPDLDVLVDVVDRSPAPAAA